MRKAGCPWHSWASDQGGILGRRRDLISGLPDRPENTSITEPTVESRSWMSLDPAALAAQDAC